MMNMMNCEVRLALSYVRVESDNAAEYLCQVADHDDGEADHGEGDDEAGVAAQQAGGRNYGEDQLERSTVSLLLL